MPQTKNHRSGQPQSYYNAQCFAGSTTQNEQNMISGSELVGSRGKTLVGRLPAQRLIPLWRSVTSGVVKQGFALEYRDLEPPRTGIFDGLKIVIDPDVDFEMQCFILLHLFGHSVQWTAPSLAK